jgi:hypothetical protein
LLSRGGGRFHGINGHWNSVGKKPDRIVDIRVADAGMKHDAIASRILKSWG